MERVPQTPFIMVMRSARRKLLKAVRRGKEEDKGMSAFLSGLRIEMNILRGQIGDAPDKREMPLIILVLLQQLLLLLCDREPLDR
jgi:hypothetical protein